MRMDKFSSFKQQEEVHLRLSSGACLEQDMHVMYGGANGYVLCVGRATSAAETHHGYDLESGIMNSKQEASSFLASARSLFEKVRGRMSFTERVIGSIGGRTGSSGVQCGAPCDCQQRVAKMGFIEPAISGFRKQGSQELDRVKTGNTVSGCSEKIRLGDANIAVKPGWKKPPRPPKATTDHSKERHMKGISDTILVRRARLERMRSLRGQKVGKPSSTKTTLWALLITVSFFVIVIIQGSL